MPASRSLRPAILRTACFFFLLSVLLGSGLPAFPSAAATPADRISLVSKGLVGVGRIPANQRDKFGETFGSGSGMAISRADWARDGGGYKGTIWLLPDRGYNVEGTTDYRERVNKLTVKFIV